MNLFAFVNDLSVAFLISFSVCNLDEPMASASKVDEMREMMKGFCQMERDVEAVLEAVNQVKQEVTWINFNPNMDKLSYAAPLKFGDW